MSEVNDPNNPLVYLSRHNGKRLAVCLSTVGKWAAGVLATLITAGFIAVASLVWSSAENSKIAVIELRYLREDVEEYKQSNEARLLRYEERLRSHERDRP